jgi:hypothetical protein
MQLNSRGRQRLGGILALTLVWATAACNNMGAQSATTEQPTHDALDPAALQARLRAAAIKINTFLD